MSAATLKFKIFDGKGTQVLQIAKSTATIGSATHCDLVLGHASVQAEHVRVWCEGGRIWAQDLGAPSGTTLNGIRLPHLKPMLVRELDMLKLGECATTLGLEPNLVRAPVVKPVENLEEITLTEIRPLTPVEASDTAVESKRAEFERVSRQLAEVKLHVQMARLEKHADKEADREIADLKAELAFLKQSMAQIDEEKLKYKRHLDHGMAELKLKYLREMKDQRDADQLAFDEWKKDGAHQLNEQVLRLLEIKAKSARAFTRENVLAWQDDFKHTIRRSFFPTSYTLTPEDGERRARKRLTPSNLEALASRVALVVAGLALFMGALWFLSGYIKGEMKSRGLASKAETVRFQLAKSEAFKRSYSENVVYTTSYLEAERSERVQASWRQELSRVARSEWQLDDNAIRAILSKERSLLQDLTTMAASISSTQQETHVLTQMRAREARFAQELKEPLGKRGSAERFMLLKKTFFARNPVYLLQETR